MPNNTSGPKKARWSTSQKAEARKAPKRAARSEGDVGTKRPRAERSPRWDREDPRRTDRPRTTGRPDDRGDARGSAYSRDSTPRSSTPSRGSGDRREQRPVQRPHDERPRRERGDRPVRDQAPRVADPARRDRHEGRHVERDAPRAGYRNDDRGSSRPDASRGGYAGDRARSDDRGSARPERGGYRNDDRGSSRPDASRGGFRNDDRGSSRPERGGYRNDDRGSSRPPASRGGYAGDRPRRDDRGDRFAPRGEDGPVTFEEAEAARAEADTWTAYSSAAGGAKDVTEDNGFAALGLPERLVERLARDGITEPFPIQVATIPDALAGRDVLGRARTGSGKTLAFGLTMIARLADGTRPESKRPRSLILVPTRELAMQVSDALEPFVHVTGLRHKLVAGGLSYEPQIKALNKGIDILVATPGRLADLMERDVDVDRCVVDGAQ